MTKPVVQQTTKFLLIRVPIFSTDPRQFAFEAYRFDELSHAAVFLVSSAELLRAFVTVATPPMRTDVFNEYGACLIERQLFWHSKFVVDINDLISPDTRQVPPSIYGASLRYIYQVEFTAMDVDCK